MRYRIEIKIGGNIYQGGDDVPVMVSESLFPLVVLEGNDIEDLLFRLSSIGDTIKVRYGKEDKESSDLHWEGEGIGVNICRN